jgi:hypothetical protein
MGFLFDKLAAYVGCRFVGGVLAGINGSHLIEDCVGGCEEVNPSSDSSAGITNPPTSTLFVGCIKAFDTANHELLFTLLHFKANDGLVHRCQPTLTDEKIGYLSIIA